jgi:hypothetical protein
LILPAPTNYVFLILVHACCAAEALDVLCRQDLPNQNVVTHNMTSAAGLMLFGGLIAGGYNATIIHSFQSRLRHLFAACWILAARVAIENKCANSITRVVAHIHFPHARIEHFCTFFYRIICFVSFLTFVVQTIPYSHVRCRYQNPVLGACTLAGQS